MSTPELPATISKSESVSNKNDDRKAREDAMAATSTDYAGDTSSTNAAGDATSTV